MVERGIEHGLFFLRAALYEYARKVGVPFFLSLGTHLVKGLAREFGFEVAPRPFDADERHAQAHLNLFARCGIETEPCADVVAREFFGVARVEFIFIVVGVPFCFYAFLGTLEFPITRSEPFALHAHHEVNGKDRLARIVAERAEEFAAHHLVRRGAAQRGTRFVGKSLAEVEQDVRTAAGEGVAVDGAARRGGDLRFHSVAREGVGVIARARLLGSVGGTVLAEIHAERIGHCGHHEQRTEVGAAHAAEVHMGIAREEHVVELVRRAPPAAVLVVFVLVGPHHVERHDAHHAARANRARIAGAEVGGADKRIDVVHRLLLGKAARQVKQGCK